MLHWLFVSITGLLFGSFASALVYRIPREIPWVYDKSPKGQQKPCRSECTSCHARLGVFDLIPLFSWLALRGKCRHCAARVSALYPLVELTCLAGFWAVFLTVGLEPEYIALYLMVPFLVALIYIDIEHFILPNQLVGILAILGAVHLGLMWGFDGVAFEKIVSKHVLGALVFGGFSWGLGALMSRLLKKEALGFGDVKFFAVAGLWLGLSKFSLFLILSGVSGVLFALCWRFFKKETLFPFGPALILSFFASLLYDGSHFY